MKFSVFILFVSSLAVAKEDIKSNPCTALMSITMRMTPASMMSESPFVFKKNKLVARESLKVTTKEMDKNKEVYLYTDSNELNRRIEISGQGNQFYLNETFDPLTYEKILEANSDGRIRPTKEKTQGSTVAYQVKDGACYIQQMGIDFSEDGKNFSLIGYDASFCEKVAKKINLNSGGDEVIAVCSKVFEDLNYIYTSREVELQKEKKTFGKKSPQLDSIYNLAEVVLNCKPKAWQHGLDRFVQDFSQQGERRNRGDINLEKKKKKLKSNI